MVDFQKRGRGRPVDLKPVHLSPLYKTACEISKVQAISSGNGSSGEESEGSVPLPPTCSLNSLPDEVILQILSGLSLPEVQCTVARSSNNMRGLRTWAVCCFRELAEIKLVSNYKTRELAPLKITQKALYDDVWPDYLCLKFHIGTKLAIQTQRDTFQDSAARLFNTLPDRLRQEPNYSKFIRLAKKLMFSKGESI
ncbi:unnamed protein product [Porites evermanni]|uniref:F-box domain-containing protein n=1 Tax=Porites evermanni TaxID=104178 RepID=A0ABN8MFB7_9CNID|nr:unnamed protein product [Porites evermanni]